MATSGDSAAIKSGDSSGLFWPRRLLMMFLVLAPVLLIAAARTAHVAA